jgi:hypothetical protein
MRTIKVIKIEGLENTDKGSTVQMYTYEEMRSHKEYCRDEESNDEFVNNMSSPIGWVVQERLNDGWIFIPILPSDIYEEVKDNHTEIMSMHSDLAHSGVLN